MVEILFMLCDSFVLTNYPYYPHEVFILKTYKPRHAPHLHIHIQVVDFPEDWIVGCDVPGGVDGLENWYVVEAPDTLRIPEAGITMSIVDRPEVSSNLKITTDTIWRNIRETFERLNIKVYIFNDRVEIRGYIPTEIIPIPHEARGRKRGAVSCSTRGLRGRSHHH